MGNFLTELKRRNVIRVGLAYIVVAWVIAQVFDLAADNFGSPDWVMKTVLTLLVAGLPIALLFAWAFELTPDGVKKTRDVPAESSITPRTGHKLNRLTTVALILALAFIAWDKLGPADEPAPTAISDKSVAVLPFADLSENNDQEWFSDGLTEEILNSLARLPELKVTARTSSFEFKNTNIDISDIATRLGVAHVVEGSVRRIGDRLRVTAQLIRANDGFHLWSDTYDRTTDDMFEVQRDVAESIAATLNVILDEQKRDQMFSYGTNNVAAFDAYLKGAELFLRAHVRDADQQITLAEANRYFDKAMELDPTFAEPALLHSDRYAHYLIESKAAKIIGNNDELDEVTAYSALQQDLEFASNNAPDQVSRIIAELNRVFFSTSWHRLPALVRQLKDSIGNETRFPTRNLWVNEILLLMGEYELLEIIIGGRIESDPLNAARRRDLAELHIARGDYDAAAAVVDETRRTIGDEPLLRTIDVRIALLQQDHETARQLLQDDFLVSDDFEFLAPVRAALEGKPDDARRMIDSMMRDASSSFIASTLLKDEDRIREAVQKLDKQTAGPTGLAIDIAYSGKLMWLDLDAAPNLKKRLAEAQIEIADVIGEI